MKFVIVAIRLYLCIQTPLVEDDDNDGLTFGLTKHKLRLSVKVFTVCSGGYSGKVR